MEESAAKSQITVDPIHEFDLGDNWCPFQHRLSNSLSQVRSMWVEAREPTSRLRPIGVGKKCQIDESLLSPGISIGDECHVKKFAVVFGEGAQICCESESILVARITSAYGESTLTVIPRVSEICAPHRPPETKGTNRRKKRHRCGGTGGMPDASNGRNNRVPRSAP
mmetsp:Transcript_3020/g.6689  ORF Transcript_3020/g.6689 Transcript_3020/m.6689 type:complete len:167 (-) Transcript_3020:269-769(-)|eukprot:CAMPEP_0116840602 /NCGR_PEP_ID=MMETSP0418-20121206/10453_1 /TAXON_ID=1158023 /ORGANISM="Astrosyne radiata, Strain 13vi08-1A" /LENGTH=166 /DNA_ID=CAMNT_0004470921 /DNA_START=726 /DNA_END=1226 /DNA_ORIENTATION=-